MLRVKTGSDVILLAIRGSDFDVCEDCGAYDHKDGCLVLRGTVFLYLGIWDLHLEILSSGYGFHPAVCLLRSPRRIKTRL